MPPYFRTFQALTLALAGTFALGLPAESPRDGWESAEAELRRAVAAGDVQAARNAIEELARTREPRGYRAIMKYALEGREYGIFSFAAGALVTVKDPAIRNEVYTVLRRTPNPKTRIILLAVVRRWADDPAALAAIHDRLRDPSRPVVFAAIRWIQEINKPEVSMEPLIEELARREKEKGRAYFDIKKALRQMTGHSFAAAADWRNYWEVRKENPEAAAAPPKGKGRTVLASEPRFFSLAVDSTRVVFVIDTSGSMALEDVVVVEEDDEEEEEIIGGGTTVVRIRRPRTVAAGGEGGSSGEGGEGEPRVRMYKRRRIDAAKDELMRTIQALPSSVHFNIIGFNHELRFFDPNPGLLQATAEAKRKAIRWVSGLQPSGATRTDAALAQALELVDVDTIYLLTDGYPKTVNNEDIPAEYIFDLVDTTNRFRKCRINTVGFSQGGPTMKRFVSELARRNDGHCILLE